MRATDLLIVGGVKDPNIGVLSAAAHKMDCAAVTLTFGDNAEPGINWDLEAGRLYLDGQSLAPRAAFLRQDVFSYRDSMQPDRLDKGLAWHSAITGACFSDDDIRVFNRQMDWRTSSKPIMLKLARQHGLPIPETVVSNCEDIIASLHRRAPRIAKPVAGGAYCRDLDAILKSPPWRNGVAPVPAIVQDRLDYPEYRVYVVGERLMVFEVLSDVIDYRTDRRSRIRSVPTDELPAAVRTGLLSLTRAVGIDFGAADFKTRKSSGEICFLELNNQPMFASHDHACDGALANSIVETLLA